MKEIAIYLRLSKADKERTRESQSIQNQRALLYKAIREDASFGEYPITAYIDEDIAAEFGIENGQKLTMEEVDDFLTKAHEKYPDRYALIPQSGDSMINGDWTWDGLGDTKLLGVLEDQAQTTEVKDLFKTDDFIDFCTWTLKWYQDGILCRTY